MAEPKEVFFPTIRLDRSKKSRTTKCLYSASTSKMFGPGSRIELYFAPESLRDPPPGAVEIMVYEGGEPLSNDDCAVYELGGWYKCPATAYRYEEVVQTSKLRIGSVYLPVRMFGATAPKRIWLAVNMRPQVLPE